MLLGDLGGEAGGLVQLGDRLFWGHESFDGDLSDGFGFVVGVMGGDFEHDDRVFDLVEPETFTLVFDGDVGAVDVGGSAPD